MKDKNGTDLAVGDRVRWQGRPCTVLKFEKGYEHIITIDDPGAPFKFIGAKGTERPVRDDEVEKF